MYYGKSPIYEMEITIPEGSKIKIEVDAFCNIKYNVLTDKADLRNKIKIFEVNYWLPLATAIASTFPQITWKLLKFGNVLSSFAELLDKAAKKVSNNSSGKTNNAGFPDSISSFKEEDSSGTLIVNKQTLSFSEPSDKIISHKSARYEE